MARKYEDDGGPAFPISYADGHRDGAGGHIYSSGMSLRDWFAGQALVGIELKAEALDWSPEGIATRAYLLADAMLAAREGRS